MAQMKQATYIKAAMNAQALASYARACAELIRFDQPKLNAMNAMYYRRQKQAERFGRRAVSIATAQTITIARLKEYRIADAPLCDECGCKHYPGANTLCHKWQGKRQP